MQRKRFTSLSFLVTIFAALAALLLLMAPTEAAPAHEEAAVAEWTVVADGLANPRHLTFGPDGALYVAEAGEGGDGPCVPGAEGEQCFGATGAVTQVTFDADSVPTGQSRVITGLPSLAAPDSGDAATGPHDVAFDGSDLYVVTGLGGDPAWRETGGPLETVGGDLAQILSTGPGDAFAGWVDLGDYEAANNPAGDEPNTNPFALERLAGGYLVADAGGNDLLAVTDAGVISTVAVFPDRDVEFPPGTGNMVPMDAVPTAVVVGPDGAYYVSQLTGFPFPPGAANIWRVEPGNEPEVYAEGFTNVLDLAFAADGSLYVLEMFTRGMLEEDPLGAVVRVDPDGSRSVVAREGLETPTGMTIGPDHALYVSNFGTSAEEGQVVRIPTRLSEAGQFSAVLSGENEVPPVDTDASGVARFSLADDGTLSYEVAVRDITGITASHIHLGAAGVNGGVIFTLYDGTGTFDPDNPISGSVSLTPEQVDELLAGNYYVNVHTTANPGGEIRGQIYPAQTWAFGAFLAGQNEVPHVNTTSAGRAFLTLSADMTQLHYLVILENTPDVTASHIHEAPAGANGPVIFPLFTGGPPPFDEDNPVKGTLTPTISQVAALLGGDYYVNVHTTTYPGGEIRGQLAAVTPRLDSHALLTGDNVNPEPVDTDALGLGTFSLSADLSTLDYTLVVDEITGITGAHLHAGWPEGTGPLVHALVDSGDEFDPDNPVSGLLPFDAQHVLDYWTGYYYVDVPTTANVSGEIRDQLEGPSLFEAYLSGYNEVPPVTTAASGHAVLALSEDASTLYYRVRVEDITGVTASHIHAGGEGENGPVVFPLFTGGPPPFNEANPISGSISVSEEDILAILADDYYVNVHTTANPGGEIRGQITGYDEFDFFEAFLDGDQEVPPVNTDATGFGFFNFDDGNSAVYYNVSVENIDNVTAAHIHVGPVGQNGPVVFPLYTGDGVFDPDHSVSGGVVMSAENLVDMFTGFFYTNVHTTEYPAGEIRGQIQVRPEIVYMPVAIP